MNNLLDQMTKLREDTVIYRRDDGALLKVSSLRPNGTSDEWSAHLLRIDSDGRGSVCEVLIPGRWVDPDYADSYQVTPCDRRVNR